MEVQGLKETEVVEETEEVEEEEVGNSINMNKFSKEERLKMREENSGSKHRLVDSEGRKLFTSFNMKDVLKLEEKKRKLAEEVEIHDGEFYKEDNIKKLNLEKLEEMWESDDSEERDLGRFSNIAGGVVEVDSEGAGEPSRRKKRSSEELFNNLKGRFVNDLEWIPESSVLSNFMKKHKREIWCVKGLVLLRDVGLCRVCGDRVRGQTWKVVKVDKDRAWEESNCLLVCGQCAQCMISREFFGTMLEKVRQLRLFILNRRQKGTGGVKELSQYGYSVLVVLRSLKKGNSVEGVRANKNTLKGLKNMPKRSLK